MLARRTLRLWSLAAVFGLTAASISWTYRSLCPPPATPKTLPELAELLSQKDPSLCVVPEVENKPELGIYICTQPRSRERLQILARSMIALGKSSHGNWHGVVFCERTENCFLLGDDELQSWGEHGMRIGPLVFFGDPTLLRRIHELIFHCSGERHDR